MRFTQMLHATTIKYMQTKTFIKYLILGSIMTTTCVFLAINGNIIGWIGTVFFGFILVGIIIKYFNPSFKYINVDHLESPKYQKLTEEEFMKKYEDDGIFEYDQRGFATVVDNRPQRINWNDIQSLVAYKEDHFATDCICLDIVKKDGQIFKITEETEGWHKFLNKSKEQFPQVDKSWDIGITNPPFDPKVTLIYDQDNRTLQEVIDSQKQI